MNTNMTLDIDTWGSRSIFWVKSDRVAESMEAVYSHGIDLVGISPERGYGRQSISFLREYPATQGLVIPFASQYSLDPLASLSALKYLQIGESREPLDLHYFPHLVELRLEWHAGIQWAELPALRSLYLRGYEPSSKDISELPLFPQLEELEFNQGNLQAMTGIDRFRALLRLHLYNLRGLENVGSLCGTRLEFLHIESCKRIQDLETLSCLTEVIALRINDCGRVASLQFIERMARLQELRFVGTLVEDGDMTPLMRLDTVGFLPRRGYSHTPIQVETEIRSRRNAT